MQRSTKSLWVVAILWLGLSISILFAMADYGATQGRGADPPRTWSAPLSEQFESKDSMPTLVLFAHPLCPCTRASLWELESIANRLFGLFDTHVLFFEPENKSQMSEIWDARDLKKIAARIPGAQLHVDVEGELAKQFGTYTSGQVLLYGSDGALQFAGGITPSRGHTGSNPGRATVISSILSDEGVDPLQALINPVFGCSLHDEKPDDRKLQSVPDLGDLPPSVAPLIELTAAAGSLRLAENLRTPKATGKNHGVKP